jgi:hypothetical protein
MVTPLDAFIQVAPVDNGYLLTYSAPGAFRGERRRFFANKGELLTFLKDHWPESDPQES